MLSNMTEKPKFIRRIINLFQRPVVRTTGLPAWPHPIEGTKPEPDHEIAGVVYYHFPNDFQARTRRVLAAYDIYRELQYNLSGEDVEAYLEAVSQALNKGDLQRIAVLTYEVKKRHKFIKNYDLLYKLWSVVFFDNTEDPTDYDFTYAGRKIERVKDIPEVPAFFFQKADQRLSALFRHLKSRYPHLFKDQKRADRGQKSTIESSFVSAVLSGRQHRREQLISVCQGDIVLADLMERRPIEAHYTDLTKMLKDLEEKQKQAQKQINSQSKR